MKKQVILQISIESTLVLDIILGNFIQTFFYIFSMTMHVIESPLTLVAMVVHFEN